MLERADLVRGPLVVGRKYRVPVMRIVGDGRVREFAVVPNIHKDPELGVNIDHVHFDYRFVNARVESKLYEPLLPFGPVVRVGKVGSDRRVRHRVMRCIRPLNFQTPTSPVTIAAREINRICMGKRFNGQTCPHRGHNLEGLPRDTDGVVTCPLHGAKWRRDGSYQPSDERF